LLGDKTLKATGINEIHQVQPGDVTFVDVRKYFSKALQSAASVILLNERATCPEGKALLLCEAPFEAYNQLVLAERPIPAVRVTALIDQISSLYGYPERIRVDNGPEFISATFHGWAAKRKIQVEHIRPGKPTENPYIESFNSS
jgi:transposase InsO family protein